MTVEGSLEGENVTWLADGYKYGMNRPGSSASSQFIADKPPIPFTRPVVKLGSGNVMVLGAQTPAQAALQIPKRPQERRVFLSTYEKLFGSLSEPLNGEKYQSCEKKKFSRPRSAPTASFEHKVSSTAPSRSSSPSLRASLPPRPTSAQPPTIVRPPVSPRPASARSRMQTGRSRVRSAGSHATGRSPAELRKSFTFVTRNYEEEMYKRHTYAPPVPCPDMRYLDRHARCFDHAHVHTQLQRQIPTAACDKCHSHCPARNIAYELDQEDRKRIEEESKAYYKRYVDSMRPKTAPPSLRLEQQNKLPLSPHSNNQRGVTPHFCNFVRKVRLNEKENEKPLADHSHVHSHVHSSHNNESDLLDATSNSLNIGSSWGRRSNTAWSAVRSVSEVNEPPESIFTPRNESYEGEEADAQTNWPGAEIRIPTPRPESPGEEVTGIDDKDVKPEHDGSDVTDEATTKKSVPPPPPPKLTRPTVKEEPHEGPNQHTNEATKKQRAPIKKKERKPFERQRRTQEEEEEVGEAMEEEEKQPEQKEKIPEPIPEPPAPKVIETPELPTFKKEKKEEVKRVPSRAERHAIPVVPPVQIKQPEQTESMRDARKAFELNLPEMSKEDVNIQRPKVQPWLQGRLALSQQSCRFELPIDMRVLEKLSAVDYLRSYCVITTRRETLYQKIHGRYKDRTGKVSVKDLEKALRDVLINTITKEDIKRICEVVGLNAESAIEYKLFAGIAAMAERMLYPKFLTEDTQDKSEYKKEKIECADFSALEWKFHGVNVNPQVRRVLESL